MGLLLFARFSLSASSQQLPLVQIERPSSVSVVAGQEQQLTLSFTISNGYHIQANQPADENLIPTVLTFAASNQINVGSPVFPAPTKFRMLGTEEDLLVFGDTLEIKIRITASPLAENGQHTLKGELHYQACDSFKCYFPRDIEFAVEVQVE